MAVNRAVSSHLPWLIVNQSGTTSRVGMLVQPRSLAGKPLAGFRATPSRPNPVLYGMVVYAIRFKNPLLHRQSTLKKRRLGENRVSGQTSRAQNILGK